jgi:hypothetical protein
LAAAVLARVLEQSYVLQGRYQLLECLGENGGRQTWRSRDQKLDQTVAIKILALPMWFVTSVALSILYSLYQKIAALILTARQQLRSTVTFSKSSRTA